MTARKAREKAQERERISILPLLVEMEEVERPLSSKSTWPIEGEAKAIASTVETGKALRLKFRNAEELRKIQMALRHLISKQGLVMRYRKDAADRIIAWAEKVKGVKGA